MRITIRSGAFCRTISPLTFGCLILTIDFNKHGIINIPGESIFDGG